MLSFCVEILILSPRVLNGHNVWLCAPHPFNYHLSPTDRAGAVRHGNGIAVCPEQDLLWS